MKNLKEIRKRKHLTQKEIAEKLHITQATYSGYENQKYSPTIDVLCELSYILETPIDEIVGNTPTKDSKNYDEWLMQNILFKIKKLNKDNMLQLDGYITAKIQDQEEQERNEYLKDIKKG